MVVKIIDIYNVKEGIGQMIFSFNDMRHTNVDGVYLDVNLISFADLSFNSLLSNNDINVTEIWFGFTVSN